MTGAGRGIGRALCRALLERGAAGVVVADLDGKLARATAAELGGLGLQCDVTDEAAVNAAVGAALRHYDRVDILVSNAGFGVTELDLDDALSTPNATWQRMWDVHVMAHVYASRALLPGMLERGTGYLVNVASAAGVLSQIGDTAYSATKHAAVGLAESLAITYAERGIRVSVVCPQYVATAITGLDEKLPEGSVAGVLTVEQAARAIVEGLEREQFLVLTHPEVLGFFQRKAADYDRWLAGMRRLRAGLRAAGGFLKVKA
ncbi:MAG TPA: SDR family NAD(P)-dependent oxidoreductase [Steroidobacteraceae bacterium]|nr:SDR family NAD(P)-dependent oxidoreductase [Steroidobacteraceae bacterium]